MSKIISINPALFSSSGSGGTRRKQPKSGIKIKVRSTKDNENNKTTKRALLKYIRNQQAKNLERNMEKTNEKHNENTLVKPKLPTDIDNFNTDFAESLKYLTTVAEQNPLPTKHANNQTLRRLPTNENVSATANSMTNSVSANSMQIYEHLPPVFDNPLSNLPINLPLNRPSPFIHTPAPKFGCLKNGILPTYRTWKNTTQKNHQPGQIGGNVQPAYMQPVNVQALNIPQQPGGGKTDREKVLDQNLKNMSIITQSINKNNQVKKQKLYYPKQKRTLRRTYTVGKSAVFPKISVLISNKTIRNDIITKTQLLKQVPIGDVKKYLIKHGFIRVGTVSPNDVLRKMYESAILICGNINNHNPDNLLYNYLNTGTKDSV